VRLIAIVLSGAIVLAGAVSFLTGDFGSSQGREIPECAEDAVIVGFGDFEGGRWSRYACGPALDDFIPAP